MILSLDDPPHKLALAFALGIFIAFTPTIGLHLVTCFLFAWIFRVSKVVTITSSYILNPWTAVPMFGSCLWLGMMLTGRSGSDTPPIAWSELGITNFLDVLKPYLWPFVVGTLVAGTIAAIISFFVFYWVVVNYRNTKETVFDQANEKNT